MSLVSICLMWSIIIFRITFSSEWSLGCGQDEDGGRGVRGHCAQPPGPRLGRPRHHAAGDQQRVPRSRRAVHPEHSLSGTQLYAAIVQLNIKHSET